MSIAPNEFKLPKAIDRQLAALSRLYAQEGKRQLQEILVNAQVRVQEEWSRDNWNGGIFGHALYLVLPEPLFLNTLNQKDEIQNKIKEDINKIHNIQNEFIEEVFLEMEFGDNPEWRKESGLLLAGKRVVTPDSARRIWGEDGFRVFLSHKADAKKETAEIKDRLKLFGVSCFVAHEDIHPTKAWQDEIENALASMDGFVALMTANFHDSDWTDQEVGFAFARGVPIIAVRLGKDPYGFIGKFQGLSSSWLTAPQEIIKVLIKNERMFSYYVSAIRRCPSWDSGNTLAAALPAMEPLTDLQIDELVAAYNETSELRGCYAFNGGNSRSYGPGLVFHLNRFGTRQFAFTPKGRIQTIG